MENSKVEKAFMSVQKKATIFFSLTKDVIPHLIPGFGISPTKSMHVTTTVVFSCPRGGWSLTGLLQ